VHLLLVRGLYYSTTQSATKVDTNSVLVYDLCAILTVNHFSSSLGRPLFLLTGVTYYLKPSLHFTRSLALACHRGVSPTICELIGKWNETDLEKA